MAHLNNLSPKISRVWRVYAQGIKGAAVVIYRNPLTTPHMGLQGSRNIWARKDQP